MSDIELKFVKKILGEKSYPVRTKAKQDIDLGDSIQLFQSFGTDITDAGAIDHASNSEYEPPGKRDKLKGKPGSEETSKKPNIFRKTKMHNAVAKYPKVANIKIKEENMIHVVTRVGNLYTCLLCEGEDTVCDKAKAIIVHVWQAHNERLYICDLCGEDFREHNKLSIHLKEHVAIKHGQLHQMHKRKHYPQPKFWGCDTCGKKYSSKNVLDDHINIHMGVRPYVCPTCGNDFASKYVLKRHQKSHKGRSRPFQCSHYNKSFYAQRHLTEHEWTQSKQVHSTIPTSYKHFICDVCQKVFIGKAKMLYHKRSHTNERPYLCEFCGVTFKYTSNLKAHQHARHSESYKCQKCGKEFNWKRLLSDHIKSAHTKDWLFKCSICEASFLYPQSLKRHERIHTCENPFLCEVCEKPFNNRDCRNAHRFIHLDKKRYECLTCGDGFMKRIRLIEHMHSQGHFNDTIIVNKAKLITDDDQIITESADGGMEIVEGDLIAEDDGAEASNLAEHKVIEEGEDKTPSNNLISDANHSGS